MPVSKFMHMFLRSLYPMLHLTQCKAKKYFVMQGASSTCIVWCMHHDQSRGETKNTQSIKNTWILQNQVGILKSREKYKLLRNRGDVHVLSGENRKIGES